MVVVAAAGLALELVRLPALVRHREPLALPALVLAGRPLALAEASALGQPASLHLAFAAASVALPVPSLRGGYLSTSSPDRGSVSVLSAMPSHRWA